MIVPPKPSGIVPSDTNSDVILLVTFSGSVTFAVNVIGLYATFVETKRNVCVACVAHSDVVLIFNVAILGVLSVGSIIV